MIQNAGLAAGGLTALVVGLGCIATNGAVVGKRREATAKRKAGAELDVEGELLQHSSTLDCMLLQELAVFSMGRALAYQCHVSVCLSCVPSVSQ